MVDPHNVDMTGENAFIRLSEDGGKMPPGAMGRPLGVYSTFLPARGAQLAVNGEAATAKVFLQDRFGKPASSCCLAWSETWTRPAA